MAEDDDEMFMTRNLNVMPKTTEQHLIVLSYKSVAYVNIYIYIYIHFYSPYNGSTAEKNILN